MTSTNPHLRAVLVLASVAPFLAPLSGESSPVHTSAENGSLVAMAGASPKTASSLENQQGDAMAKSVENGSRRPRKAGASMRNAIATITGVCVIAGCSGVRTLPDGTGACSAEAIEETKRIGIPRSSYFSVEVLGLPGSRANVALIKEGPVELRVTNPVKAFVREEIANSPLCQKQTPDHVVPRECMGATLVSDTALLYGEVILKGERVQIRVHQLRDGGAIGPFCGVVAQQHSVATVGLAKNPQGALQTLGIAAPPPGTVAVWSRAEVLIVDDDSQQPKP
jgi:hypothetical protein